MANFTRVLVKLITGVEPVKQSTKLSMGSFLRHKLTERDLIRMESQIGGQLFGPVPAGHRREFFCLDSKTWIWHEEWNENGQRQQLTTRYEIQPNGILKMQDGQPYSMVEGEELRNLAEATRLYREQVAEHVYHRNSQTQSAYALAA